MSGRKKENCTLNKSSVEIVMRTMNRLTNVLVVKSIMSAVYSLEGSFKITKSSKNRLIQSIPFIDRSCIMR